ncbi:MAG: ABC transporter permease [Chloroflexi bacterium]|nr:MAG: ABC transporter permease [Chloroflexota bacterium]
MGAYIVRRILISIPVLLGITIIGFIALRAAPGDPLLATANPDVLANLAQHPEILEAERHALGFDQPIFPNQYVAWLGHVLQGDLGYSITSHRPISSEIGSRILSTLFLMVTAMTLAVVIGIPIGVITAVRQYSRVDYGLNALAIFLASTPVFVLGLIAIYVFAVNLHWLPTSDQHTAGKSDFPDALYHLVLPASVLAIVNAAPLVRYTRASMLDVLSSEYVTTARSKGLGSRVVILRHALRNGLIPIITLVALLIPELVAGAVITEQIFNWNGMGQLAVHAADSRDPSLMMGIILIVGTAVLFANIVADIGYAVADPRVRYVRPR